ncbi:MAG: hypothetical protein M1819_006277 [Sarea resinae]|nr:MAG: hypothetical protein M1819_006277 [Sarea resinae]
MSSPDSSVPPRDGIRQHQKTDPDKLASGDDAAVLAGLGYKQELKRNFTMIEVFGIAFSIMGIMPSIASSLSFAIPAGPVGMVWGWFLASGLIFVVGLAMADLGSAMPTSGGLYWWTHFFSSPKSRNPLCFLVGYSNTLGLIGGLVSIDYGFATMFLAVIQISKDGTWTPSRGDLYAVFVGTVLLHGVCASVLSKVMGKLQTVFVILNVIVVLATIIALPIGRRHAGERNSGHYIFAQTENLTTWPTGWAFMLSFLCPLWTIGTSLNPILCVPKLTTTGAFDSCVHMSEEAANATKAVPYGILMSIGSCWFLGFIIMIVIAACMSQDLDAILGSKFGQPMAQIYYDSVGKQGTLGLMSLLIITQFFMGLSIVVAASRQSWAFSRDGALPFSSFFRPISKKFGYIPLRTIWGCVFLALILGLLSLIDAAASQALFSLSVSGNNLAWGIPIFSRVVWGNAKFKPGPFYTGDRFSKPIAWTAIIFLIFGILLSMFPTLGPNPTPSEMNYSCVINGAVWGGSLAYYYIDARKWFKGPKITISLDDLTEEQERVLAEEGLEVEGLNPDPYGKSGAAEENREVPEKIA